MKRMTGEVQAWRRKVDLRMWFQELCWNANRLEKLRFTSLSLTEGRLGARIIVLLHSLRILLLLPGWSITSTGKASRLGS